jgi:DNA-binding LacI/PurR family transcriptional regulator
VTVVTIRDVASAAGVAESTVSRVLGGAKTAIPISEETRQRVVKAAQQLGYRANPGARLLRGKGIHLIGVIVSEIDDPFFSQLVDELGSAARSRGYDLVLGYARRDPAEVVALSEALDPRFCDGLLLLGDLNESPEDHSFLEAIRSQMPLILVCRGHNALVSSFPSVGVNNQLGARTALEHLWALGHRNIAFIGSGRLGDLWERRCAYEEFMAERGAPPAEELIRSTENNFAGGLRAMQELLALPEPPSAVFAADDTIAIGALKAALMQGRRVPGDISIIGFDDIRVSQYVHPALSTISQPIARIADAALTVFLRMERGELPLDSAEHITIDPALVRRASCAARSG